MSTTVQEVLLKADLQKPPTKVGANRNVNAEGTEKQSDFSSNKDRIDADTVRLSLETSEAVVRIKNTAFKLLAILTLLVMLFFLIVVYRVARSFYALEDTYMCNILLSVDEITSSHLAEDLCIPYRDDLYTEFGNEGTKLVGEIQDGVINVFENIINGIRVMYDIGSTVSIYYFNLICGVFSELHENIHENISFLSTFIYDVLAFMEHYLLYVVDSISDLIRTIYRQL